MMNKMSGQVHAIWNHPKDNLQSIL